MNAEQITRGDVVTFDYLGRTYQGRVTYTAITNGGQSALLVLADGAGSVSLPLDHSVTVLHDGLTGEDF